MEYCKQAAKGTNYTQNFDSSAMIYSHFRIGFDYTQRHTDTRPRGLTEVQSTGTDFIFIIIYSTR